MEKVNELRDVPLGHLVKIGRLYYAAVELVRIGGITYHGRTVRGCSFRDDGGGIEECRYSSACMAHKRPDGESVIFIKIDRS